ncbi:peptide deformylase [Alteromonas sp. 5E99-2]|uniref:peptide deformylase n=1 Tax=Alteromonas sp. 5E99-2 TaxID=2817683 RepID=UPI001A99E94D|nr:peptide deformylase [Alteromonas sp. 5E99-2]MBO1256110.1 peptide deformylase [Alteromonas sp. 5E99-2]
MNIALVGEAILKTPALPVETSHIVSESCQSFISSLMQTMLNAKGIGIAAPQVFDSRAIMIIASRPNERYPTAPVMDPLVLINPTITHYSEAQTKDWEGCLSVPSLRGKVKRSVWVDVQFQDREGTFQQRRFEDFVARIFQHEYDHLIGKTWLDHIESADDIVAESVLFKNGST